MTFVLVAAIVPVYNESSRSLERTLAGLFVQTRLPDRVVVVDDGSTRPFVVPSRWRRDVTVIRTPTNEGLANARNVGAQRTDADYLLFVNCDVVLAADWVERAISFMDGDMNAGAVSGVIVPVVGREVLRQWRLQFIEPKVHRSAVRVPMPSTWLVGHVIFVRRSVFDDVEGFDPRFRSAGEDWDFSQRVGSRGHSIVHLPTLIAESHEPATIDGLARKTIRNSGWSLARSSELPCAGVQQVRPLMTSASIVRSLGDRLARNVIKRRLRFLPVDLAIAARSLQLVWARPKPRHDEPRVAPEPSQSI